MLCPNCGKEVGDSPKLCKDCRAAKEAEKAAIAEGVAPAAPAKKGFPGSKANEDPRAAKFAKYFGFAGFWYRFFAYIIDLAILSLPGYFIGRVLAPALFGFVADIVQLAFPTGSMLFTMGAGLISVAFVSLLLQALISFLYFPLFESSPLRATPGKWIFQIVVISESGDSLTRGEAFTRNLARWTPIIPALTGLITGILIGTALDLKDAVAPIIMVGFLVSWLLSLIHYPLAGVTPNKQAIHDFIAHTVVVRRERLSHAETAWRMIGAVVFAFAVDSLFPSTRRPHTHFNISSSPPAQTTTWRTP